MCVLCSIQKWARGIAMMLPWLVIPLIGLWALSQLFPPPFRFEITSPRLACVSVLLVTLLWYEVLMPQLSAWTIRRNARLREKRRSEAIELQKLRKSATRRCRNCFTAYRDQNPGGGRFMCSYCGHFSKRPVLDLPLPPGMSNLSSEILKELVGKGGNISNGRTWSDNGWVWNGQDNMDKSNFSGGFLHGKFVYRRNRDSFMTEKSYPHVVIFACKFFRSLLSSTWCVWRKIFQVGLSDDEILVDEQRGGNLAKSENGSNFQESKSDKARRKAEEKRQARLEKEQLEEEERKQREEVARLVEERRRLSNESAKDQVKCTGPDKERRKKESEKKCQDRKKERDGGSFKSNSDAEELERKVKENDRKGELDRKIGIDRRAGMINGKGYNMEPVQYKGVTGSYSRVNTGTRYLDRVRGTFLSSSKAFSRGSLFGRSASNHTAVLKENRLGSFMDHSLAHANRKDSSQLNRAIGNMSSNGGDKQPVVLDPPSATAPKKSWGQLFSRSSTEVFPSTTNMTNRPQTKDSSDTHMQLPGQPPSAQLFDNPLDFGLPSPFTLSAFPNVSINTSSGFQSAKEYSCALPGGSPQKVLSEEAELFEDPCFVPDPMFVLGPVSESLDNSQLNMGPGFRNSDIYEKSHGLNRVSSTCEVIRRSPIESPLSRLRVNGDKHTNLSWGLNSEKAQNMQDSHVNDSMCSNAGGTWQMWTSSPLVQDGIIGGSLNWLLSDESIEEENVHRSSLQSVGSLFSNNDPVFSGTNSPVKATDGNSQSGGDVISPFISPVDPWLKETFCPPSSECDNKSTRSMQGEVNGHEATLDSNRNSANSSPFEQSPVSSWFKNQWAAYGSEDGFSSSSTAVVKPPVGGLYSNPNMQSLWSVFYDAGRLN